MSTLKSPSASIGMLYLSEPKANEWIPVQTSADFILGVGNPAGTVSGYSFKCGDKELKWEANGANPLPINMHACPNFQVKFTGETPLIPLVVATVKDQQTRHAIQQRRGSPFSASGYCTF